MQGLPPGSTGGPSRLFILRPVATTLLSAGDRVVTDGIDRLTEGAKVEVVEPQTTVADEKSPSRHEGQKGARA
ncbi:hypothetical protein A9Y87_12910 [Salmonella enterica subsp. enterica]|nr:hypothetical protein A9Y87_12910 [Salmonella enterica subsp. enterica]